MQPQHLAVIGLIIYIGIMSIVITRAKKAETKLRSEMKEDERFFQEQLLSDKLSRLAAEQIDEPQYS